MQVLKIKYQTDKESLDIIRNYMRQYSSVQHFVYNRIQEGKSQKDIKQQIKLLNNVDLLDSWFVQCSFYDIPKKQKIIFGGKKNYFQRLKNNISKKQFKLKRLSPIYSIGEVVNKGIKANRKFHIEQDLMNVTFKPNKHTKLILQLIGLNKRKQILSKLYQKQERHEIKIAYKLDLEYIYIIFNETDIYNYDTKFIKNRVLSLDLNPNYIGWSIVDWKSESEFNVIKTGVYSIKKLNDKDFNLKNKGYSTESDRKRYISNKRNFETIQIVKNIVNKSIYYKCQLISIEDLNIKSKDLDKGKYLNKLINNSWCRNTFVNNLTKRCNIHNIKLLKVKSEYSSFIGNFLYRSLNLPDMILASIEIGRRGYEFYNQYISKVKEIKKNIIRPNLSMFQKLYLESLEEFNLQPTYKDLIELYYFFKKSKIKYRLSIDQFNLQFSRFTSDKSYICCIQHESYIYYK